MFAGLDEINWSALTHAYGSADDVPGLLRQRASADPKEASEAGSDFFGNIWHQGTVYEATSYAVPFLVELLARPETHERASLVGLLASIATGSSYLEVHRAQPCFADAREQAIFEKDLAAELYWKRAARAGVQHHADLYWSLLDDPATRVSIPNLLSKLPAEQKRVRERFPGRIARAEDRVEKASLLLGLAFAARGTGEHSTLLAQFMETGDPLWRLAGALGVLMGSSATQPSLDRAVSIYFEAFRDSESMCVRDDGWLWGSGEMESLLLDSFTLLSSPANDAMRTALPVELPKLDNYNANSVAYCAMRLGFDLENLPRSEQELNPLQNALLTALARQTNVVYMDPLIRGIEEALGLS
jgi:hypothetical protein